MHQGQLSGRFDQSVVDPTTGQPLNGSFSGTFTYQAAGDPNAMLPQAQAALANSVNRVLAQKLSQQQVAVPTLAQSMPHFVPEIIAQSGVAHMGIQVTHLDVHVQVEQAPVAPGFAPGQMPPDPHTAMQNSFAQAAQDHLDPRNYEVKAKLKIGGYNINASSSGGVDTDGLANQVKDKAKSTVIWWGVGCVIIGLVVLGLAGLTWYIYAEAQSSIDSSKSGTVDSSKLKSEDWDGESTFECGGNDKKRIEGVEAKLPKETAIKASGNCQLELVDVELDAKIGIEAGGNAKVKVNGGKVTGKTAAAKATANGKITFDGTKVSGKKDGKGVDGP